jgi:hypothetical protein
LLQGRREREHRAEQWKREDRHRFAEHKRDLYAKCLTILSKWMGEVDDLAFMAGLDINQLVDDGKELPTDLLEWIKDDDRRDPTRYIDRCHELLRQVRLIAPTKIYEGVGSVISIATRASELLIFNAKPTEANDTIRGAQNELDLVADLMTEDLASAGARG